MNAHIQNYYKAVCKAFALGNIESSYYKPIATLLDGFGCNALDLSGERSGQSGENIDIKLWRGGDDTNETEPFAGVEVKKVGGIDARAVNQAKTSAARYGNVILTDNLEWRFYQAGQEKMYAGVKLFQQEGGLFTIIDDNVELFVSLVEDFLLREPAQIRSSNKLAEYMAIHAKTIRSVITGILKDDGMGQPLIDERQKNLPMFMELYGLYGRIKSELRPLLTSRSFADMYAQTIVYGLFIARYNNADNTGFNRYQAIESLREESPLLNRFFTHIASTGKTHPTLEAVIDKLCVLYSTCDITSLLDQDTRRDTIVHFYEDFLTYYDPELRKSLGVFYTPHQVVRYLVEMVDKLLIEEFDIKDGLANNERIQITVPAERHQVTKNKYSETKKITVPRVAVLDPACGTGTFHAEIIKYIKDTYFNGAKEAFYSDYIQDENGLLSRLIGFEIMMTSYVVAHLKIRRAIVDTLGSVPENLQQANVYLTNTLTKPNAAFERTEQMSLFDFSAAITDEAYKADTWKARRPIKVIIGNPPYLATSTTPFDISAYKTETDGKAKLKETTVNSLNDDYVKFFSFAEEIINRYGEGILAFVSNNGYLDNPTFRGMRASLLRTFDKIYVVDMHGSAKKQEKAPDGSKDENVFDIMQGTSLFIGVKTTKNNKWAKVERADLWGLRQQKFQQCLEGNIKYYELLPDPKMAYFISVDTETKNEYEKGVSVVELFPNYKIGVETSNDAVTIAQTRDELDKRLDVVRNAIDEKPIAELFGKFPSGQSAKSIQDDVLLNEGVITQIAYRPFDFRWTYYSGKSCGWIRRPTDKQSAGQLLKPPTSPIGKNIALCFVRSDKSQNTWAMVFIADLIMERCYLTTQTAGGAYIAPLYLHSETTIGGDKWTPNLNKEQLERLTQNLTEQPTPLEIFDYCYGVLYDPAYREKFNEFLKRDFPRVPIIENEEMFRTYVTAGERLRKLHLMQEKVPATLSFEPAKPTNLEIGSIKYQDGVLQLNADTNIIGIPENVWAYRIGGYQVIDKWLKSHKGKALTIDDFEHISNIVGLLEEAIKIQKNYNTATGGS